MSRSVNKVLLIGNLTRDPELRYTPQSNAVASFVIATNREWNTDGVKKEVVDFHNIVAWNKLAELCGQLLTKGSKVYVEGRLQTRDWMDDSGTKKYKTEVVIDEMIILSSKRTGPSQHDESQEGAEPTGGTDAPDQDIDLDKVLNEDFNQ
jgi:single-strand DNA-binding protein